MARTGWLSPRPFQRLAPLRRFWGFIKRNYGCPSTILPFPPSVAFQGAVGLGACGSPAAGAEADSSVVLLSGLSPPPLPAESATPASLLPVSYLSLQWLRNGYGSPLKGRRGHGRKALSAQPTGAQDESLRPKEWCPLSPCDTTLTKLEFQCVNLVLQVQAATVLLLCTLEQAPHVDEATIVGHQAFVLYGGSTWLCALP